MNRTTCLRLPLKYPSAHQPLGVCIDKSRDDLHDFFGGFVSDSCGNNLSCHPAAHTDYDTSQEHDEMWEVCKMYALFEGCRRSWMFEIVQENERFSEARKVE